jgi:hypothetical protein
MRRELEILAHIDDFLDGEITKEELLQSVTDVKDLDYQIESQQLIRGAIKKDAFIQESQNALSKFKLVKIITIAALSATTIGIIVITTFLINQTEEITEIRPNQQKQKTETVKIEQKTSRANSTYFVDSKPKQKTLSEKAPLKTNTPCTLVSDAIAKVNSAGIWKGCVIQDSLSYDFELKLIKIDDTHFKYTSAIKQGKEYAIIQGKCKFSNGVLNFKENKILEESSVNNKWCLKSGKLTYCRTENGPQLSGDWTGKCVPGTIILEKVNYEDEVNSKESRKVEHLKADLNAAINRTYYHSKKRFKVEVYTEEGENILKTFFNAGTGQLSPSSVQKDETIRWFLYQNENLNRGTYTARFYSLKGEFSTKKFEVN